MKPEIIIKIKLNKIGDADLENYKVSEEEKRGLRKFLDTYLNATNKYFKKFKIIGDITSDIHYG